MSQTDRTRTRSRIDPRPGPGSQDRGVPNAEGSFGWPRFVHGLSLGALVGAAIAGSRIWNRRKPGPDEPGPRRSKASDEPPSG